MRPPQPAGTAQSCLCGCHHGGRQRCRQEAAHARHSGVDVCPQHRQQRPPRVGGHACMRARNAVCTRLWVWWACAPDGWVGPGVRFARSISTHAPGPGCRCLVGRVCYAGACSLRPPAPPPPPAASSGASRPRSKSAQSRLMDASTARDRRPGPGARLPPPVKLAPLPPAPTTARAGDTPADPPDLQPDHTPRHARCRHCSPWMQQAPPSRDVMPPPPHL